MKSVVSTLLISSLLLLLGLKQACAADMSINLFPQIGKPIYGVVEFGEFVGEPNNIQISSMADYEDQGFSKPAFLNDIKFKKLSARKYLVTSDRPVSESNFVMLLDSTFPDERKIYPLEISAGIGQGSVTLTDPITMKMKMASASMNPSNLVTTPAMNTNTYAQPNVVERVVEVVRESNPVYAQQPIQPQILYSQLPMPSTGAGSEMPFYLGVIALTILLLVGMFIVVFALHRNDSPKSSHKKNDDSDNFASDMLKILMPNLVTNQQRMADNNPFLMGNQYPALPQGQGFSQSHNQWSQHSDFSHSPQSRSDIGANHWGNPENKSASQFSDRSNQQARDGSEPSNAAKNNQSREPAISKEQGEHNRHPRNPTHSAKPVEQKATSNQPSEPTQQTDAQPKRPTQARSTEGLRPQYKQQNAATASDAASEPTARSNGAQPETKKPESAEKSEKLQLAIVYMNMGDEVMARMLLDEIAREGSDSEKKEALVLKEKLNKGSRNVPFIADDKKH